MPDAVMGGYPTHWRNEGAGDRPAMFLHCSLGHSGAWGGLVSALKSDLNIIAMDLPGHGRSGAWDRSIGWQEQSARMAIALLETFGAPADIVGHSFGAVVALRIAATRPDLVRSLVLAEPVLFTAANETGRGEFADHLAEIRHMPDLLSLGKHAEVARQFSNMWGGGQDWDDIPAKQQTYMTERIELIVSGALSVFGEGDDVMPLSMIANITAPVLLVQGDLTQAVIPAVMDALAGVLPGAERFVVRGAGHMVPLSHALQVSARLRVFLNL